MMMERMPSISMMNVVNDEKKDDKKKNDDIEEAAKMMRCQSDKRTKKRKRTIEDDLKYANYLCKSMKDWENLEDFEDLMSRRIQCTNYRWKDEAPSDPYAKV